MQEQTRISLTDETARDSAPGQSLAALLALVGAKKMDVEALRARTKLTPPAFERLLGWLQQEYLVDVITSLDGERVREEIGLSEWGESVLVSLLEGTCELPELR